MFPPNPQTKKYELRWRFDYAGRPSKYGKWSSPGTTPELQAWTHNKEGLARASIEGWNVLTQEIKTLAECDGWNFVNFQWMAVAMTPASAVGIAKPVHALVGLKIVTRDDDLVVLASGDAEIVPRPEAEKKLHFATFGR